jgi:hypothetical protein
MAPARRRNAPARQQAAITRPAREQAAIGEVIAMLARIEAATIRLEEKFSEVLAQVTAQPRQRARHAPSHPVGHRLPCQDRQPPPGRTPRCAHSRRNR